LQKMARIPDHIIRHGEVYTSFVTGLI
jgi:hypothetical protein